MIRNCFVDWAGQRVPFRFIKNDPQEDRDIAFTCEINPHGDWHKAASAATKEKSLALAVSWWNEYDQKN